jgi:hypothetical protein
LLETKSGFRPLTGREKIIGVGVALARRLRLDRVNREARSEEAGEAEGIDPDFSLTGFPPEP